MTRRLPAEWESQDGVIVAWPHEQSDWSPILSEVENTYIELTKAITQFETVIIVTQKTAHVKSLLNEADVDIDNLRFADIPTNDTWARDFGPITVEDGNDHAIYDFGFNGWGLKFASNLDNQVTQQLHSQGLFKTTQLEIPGLILEGGSIESDGQGTILTTENCLLEQNRNPHLHKEEIDVAIKTLFGASKVLWLEYGYLAGDDTDSHIDTLARLCPNDTILYVKCDNPHDEHYRELALMEEQLRSFRSCYGATYNLMQLPWPNAVFDEDGKRLPATYANFLVINGAVLVPTYRSPEKDQEALSIVQKAFPESKIVGIDCYPLIKQHGSLHCITMQLPQGVLK